MGSQRINGIDEIRADHSDVVAGIESRQDVSLRAVQRDTGFHGPSHGVFVAGQFLYFTFGGRRPTGFLARHSAVLIGG